MSNRKSTALIELVETHSIMLSLNRMQLAPRSSSVTWKRALYHALSMSEAGYDSTVEKIRIALGLP